MILHVVPKGRRRLDTVCLCCPPSVRCTCVIRMFSASCAASDNIILQPGWPQQHRGRRRISWLHQVLVCTDFNLLRSEALKLALDIRPHGKQSLFASAPHVMMMIPPSHKNNLFCDNVVNSQPVCNCSIHHCKKDVSSLCPTDQSTRDSQHHRCVT